jgi:predicted unusual protein kinase regulating ubiquinone biosynthesis (AarF/ABC1/UbiB family)
MGCYTKLSVVPASISNTGAESFASTDSFSELILVNMQQSMENVWNGIRENLQSQGVFDYVAALSSTDQSMLQSVQYILHSTPTPILALAVVGLPTFFLYLLSFPPKDFLVNQEPYPRGNYDPQLARQFYSRRPLLVLRRSLQLLRLSFGFILSLLLDKYVFRDETKNEAARARELLSLVQKIGPTAIKVGQALSVRSDLIPRAYAEALSELQDKVPPFSSVQAREVLRRELGEEKYGWLKDIDLDSPVASASIGQVYRGFADVPVEVERDGDGRRSRNEKRRVEVAVKVQRPNVLAEIALDLFIVREFAPYYQKITKSATDLQALANEWGRGFIAELTYEKEAENTKKFNREMKEKGLNAVTAPVVIDELSTNQILTTEWIRGKRLDQSDEDDVARLCGVALNAYLVMLLETGTLHCE